MLAVHHPMDAGKQVWHAAADEAIRDYKNGNHGEMVGDVLWGSFEVVVGTKGIAKGIKVTRVPASSRITQLCSFSGATLVLMGDGTKKPIKRIRVGDKVTATDPVTGKQAARKVTRLWVHQDTLTKLKVGKHRITTTEDHPFWSVTDKVFERADELARGERVLTAKGGTVRVKGLQAGTARTGTAYNLTVKGLHTYHIGVSEILVHNSGVCDFDIEGLDHVRKRHMPGGNLVTRDGGLFDSDQDLASLAAATNGRIGLYNSEYNSVNYVIRTPSPIGTTGLKHGGLPTNEYTVARDPVTSELNTMYPSSSGASPSAGRGSPGLRAV